MASGYERGWEPDAPPKVPDPPVTLADRAAGLRDDLAAPEPERETLEDEWTARDREWPPPGSDELRERARGLTDWERAYGRAEAELRALEAGWWDEWLGWTRDGRDPGPAAGEAERRGWD
jgi:hypothetical protein